MPKAMDFASSPVPCSLLECAKFISDASSNAVLSALPKPSPKENSPKKVAASQTPVQLLQYKLYGGSICSTLLRAVIVWEEHERENALVKDTCLQSAFFHAWCTIFYMLVLNSKLFHIHTVAFR